MSDKLVVPYFLNLVDQPARFLGRHRHQTKADATPFVTSTWAVRGPIAGVEMHLIMGGARVLDEIDVEVLDGVIRVPIDPDSNATEKTHLVVSVPQGDKQALTLQPRTDYAESADGGDVILTLTPDEHGMVRGVPVNEITEVTVTFADMAASEDGVNKWYTLSCGALLRDAPDNVFHKNGLVAVAVTEGAHEGDVPKPADGRAWVVTKAPDRTLSNGAKIVGRTVAQYNCTASTEGDYNIEFLRDKVTAKEPAGMGGPCCR